MTNNNNNNNEMLIVPISSSSTTTTTTTTRHRKERLETIENKQAKLLSFLFFVALGYIVSINTSLGPSRFVVTTTVHNSNNNINHEVQKSSSDTKSPQPPAPLLSSSSSSSSSSSAQSPHLHYGGSPHILHSISHNLASIPSIHRLPRDYFSNESYNNSNQQQQQNINGEISPFGLFTYNPSIIPLPPQFKTTTTNNSSSSSSAAVYLASYRITNRHSCGFDTTTYYQSHPLLLNSSSSLWTTGAIELFGLALLDESLQIVEGSDVVIDLNLAMEEQRRRKRQKTLFFQDVRLFVLGGTVYLSSADLLVAVEIDYRGMRGTTNRDDDDDDDSRIKINNVWGDGLQIYQILHPEKIIRIRREGKNFQFFQQPQPSSNNNNNNSHAHDVLMEYWPSSPRITIHYHLHLDNDNNKKKIYETNISESPFVPPPMGRLHLSSSSTTTGGATAAAAAADNYHKYLMSRFTKRDRATACCVRIQRRFYEDFLDGLQDDSVRRRITDFDSPDEDDDDDDDDDYYSSNNKYLLVGIAHSKTHTRLRSIYGSTRYKYLSRIYALSPRPPYHLVLRSHLFCFPFATASKDDDPHHDSTYRFNKLDIDSRVYDCPNIHFVSGLTEMVTDDSKIVVAYGVNDCSSVMVEVEKRDIMMRLLTNDDSTATN